MARRARTARRGEKRRERQKERGKVLSIYQTAIFHYNPSSSLLPSPPPSTGCNLHPSSASASYYGTPYRGVYVVGPSKKTRENYSTHRPVARCSIHIPTVYITSHHAIGTLRRSPISSRRQACRVGKVNSARVYVLNLEAARLISTNRDHYRLLSSLLHYNTTIILHYTTTTIYTLLYIIDSPPSTRHSRA